MSTSSFLPPAPTLSQSALKAATFRALHNTPNQPLLLANIYDAPSARAVASHPSCKALATASWAFAHYLNKPDEALTLEDNLSLVHPIAAVAHELDLPLTVDIQDGYAAPGDRDGLRGLVKRLIVEFGVVGVNLEDSWHEKGNGEMMGEGEAVERIRCVLAAARELGVDDFVINARSDTFLSGGSLDESIWRGKIYLEAGAETIFVFWPRDKEMKRDDVQRVIDELGGRVNISCRLGETEKGGLTTRELGEMGASRVSVGPQVYLAAIEAAKKAAGVIFGMY